MRKKLLEERIDFLIGELKSLKSEIKGENKVLPLKDVSQSAKTFKEHLKNLKGFEVKKRSGHFKKRGLAEILTWTILQQGMRHTTANKKLERIRKKYPKVKEVSDFFYLLEIKGPNEFLGMNNRRKNKALMDFTSLLHEEGLETLKDIRIWLEKPENELLLTNIKGIGDKSVDWLGIMLGCDRVAVDIHIKNLLKEAGVYFKDYDHAKKIVFKTAELMKVSRRDMDYSLWSFKTKHKGLEEKVA